MATLATIPTQPGTEVIRVLLTVDSGSDLDDLLGTHVTLTGDLEFDATVTFSGIDPYRRNDPSAGDTFLNLKQAGVGSFITWRDTGMNATARLLVASSSDADTVRECEYNAVFASSYFWVAPVDLGAMSTGSTLNLVLVVPPPPTQDVSLTASAGNPTGTVAAAAAPAPIRNATLTASAGTPTGAVAADSAVVATLTTIPPQPGTEVLRVLLTLNSGSDTEDLERTITLTGDAEFDATLSFTGLRPYRRNSPSAGETRFRIRRGASGNFVTWRDQGRNATARLLVASSSDDVTVRECEHESITATRWWWIAPVDLGEMSTGSTLNLVLVVPPVVDVDATLTATAGEPTGTVAAAAAPAPVHDATLTVRAGNPTATITAAAAPAPIHDATITAEAGSPTGTVAAAAAPPMATLTTIPPQPGTEVLRVLLTLDSGTDTDNLLTTITLTGDAELDATLAFTGIRPYLRDAPSAGETQFSLLKTGAGDFATWRNMGSNVTARLLVASSSDDVTVRECEHQSVTTTRWWWVAPVDLGAMSTGSTLNLVLAVPPVVVDATLTARAGNPTGTVTAAAAPAPVHDATLTAEAGDPTGTIAAASVVVPTQDVSLTASAGSPTGTLAADSAVMPTHNATLTARAGTPTGTVTAATASAPSHDAILTAEAGSPTGAVAAAAAPAPIHNATLTARAGSPTATVVAATASAPIHNVTLTATAGDPTGTVAAESAIVPIHDAVLTASAGSPTATVTAAAAPAPVHNATLTVRAGNPTAVLAPAGEMAVVISARAGSPTAVLAPAGEMAVVIAARAGSPTVPLIAATDRNPYAATMSRGIPYVPLASAPANSGITLAHIIAASNLAADRCGWTDDYLIPTVKSWRIPSAKAGPWRYEMGMPVISTVTPGIMIDDHVIQYTAARDGGVKIVAVMGFGWLESLGRLTITVGIDTAIIPGLDVSPGSSYLVGNEFVWFDAHSAIVRLTPFVHAAGDPISRVHTNTTLAAAILRLAGRQNDYENRAGYSARDAQRPQPNAKVEDFRIMDTEAAQSLQPFIRPPMTTWKRPSNYGLLASEQADVSPAPPSLDVADVLAAIREGDDIDIDRSVDGQITINADPGGGLEIASLYALTTVAATQPTAAELLAGTHAFSGTIVLPGYAGSQYYWFAADQGIQNLRETGSSFSAFSAFGDPTGIVVGGVQHYLYGSIAPFAARAASQSWRAVAGPAPVLATTIYGGIRVTPGDFVAADFTFGPTTSPLQYPSNQGWYGIAWPEQAGPVTFIGLGIGGFNQINHFTEQSAAIILGGVSHTIWRSNNPLGASQILEVR